MREKHCKEIVTWHFFPTEINFFPISKGFHQNICIKIFEVNPSLVHTVLHFWWIQLKAHLRCIGARTFDLFITAIYEICDFFTPEEGNRFCVPRHTYALIWRRPRDAAIIPRSSASPFNRPTAG